MVSIFGSNLYSAYTNGSSVTMIYTNGVKVWPDNPVPPGEYYVKWTPTGLSGSFIMGGETRWLQDYSGLYTGPFMSHTGTTYAYIDEYAFQSTGVVYIETNADIIDFCAFKSCSSLIYVSATCKATDNAAFEDCSSLRTINFPLCNKFNPYTFRRCINLLNVSAPNVAVLENGVFYNCTNLHELILPKCRFVGEWGMLNCNKLSYAELGVCSVIGQQAFANCINLSALTIGYSGVCSFYQSCFQNTPNLSVIYVPLEWVSAYQSTYSYTAPSYFQPIPNN